MDENEKIKQARSLISLDSHPQAMTVLDDIINRNPQQHTAIHLKGMIALKENHHQQAVDLYQTAIAIYPHPNYFLNQAGAYFHLNQKAAFKEAYTTYLSMRPTDHAEHYKYSQLLQEFKSLEDLTACLQHLQAAIKLDDQAHYHGAAAYIWTLLKDYSKALDHYSQAFEKDQSNAKEYLEMLSKHNEHDQVLQRINDISHSGGMNSYFKLLSALSKLAQGQLLEGLKDYAVRKGSSLIQTPELFDPLVEWQGQRLDGKNLLIIEEQGYGDSFQFVRYINHIKKKSGKIYLFTRKPTVQLFSQIDNLDFIAATFPTEVYRANQPKLVLSDQAEHQIHYKVHLMDLPLLLGLDQDKIPANVPYLNAPSYIPPRLSVHQTNAFKVGIIWTGNPDHKNDAFRSTELHHFLDLLSIENVELYSLQKNDDVDAGQLKPLSPLVTDFGSQFNDFTDTATALSQLDLVITVDTSVAHLAGALNKPTWVLLTSHGTDWRWLQNRDDSPWYPSVRLFRQSRDNDWTELFERVKTALSKQVTQHETDLHTQKTG